MSHNEELSLFQRKLNSVDQKSLRLLIAADSTNRLNELKMELGGRGISITAMTLPDKLTELRADRHDLVVIDASPARLKDSLKAFRERSESKETPLLVAAQRTTAAPELLGVLPQFRAMPCGPAELRWLIRHYLNGAEPQINRKPML
jgi:hypothetical protein